MTMVNSIRKCSPDSETAKSYEMGRTKLGYFVNFDLQPYLHGLLTESIKKSLYYSISFDESLNDLFQYCQMNLHIRSWNNNLNLVKSRYFDSQFLVHPTAKNLLESMITSLATINSINLMQLSMDGPNVNCLLLDLLKKQHKQQELPKLLNMGSCNLHVIHSALKVIFNMLNGTLGS